MSRGLAPFLIRRQAIVFNYTNRGFSADRKHREEHRLGKFRRPGRISVFGGYADISARRAEAEFPRLVLCEFLWLMELR